jgi:hypothetical protein
LREEHTRTSADTAAPPVRIEAPEAEVRAQLHAILESAEFRTSQRCCDFLAFVVEQTLAGLPQGLKERTIGVQVFGRPASYDTNVEGVVRIKASEVRRRLAVYYAGPGKDDAVRIELPLGGYVPTIHWQRQPATETELHPASEGEQLPVSAVAGRPPLRGSAEGRRRWRRLTIVGTVILLAALAAGLFWKARSPSMVEQLWAPLFESPGPVLVAAAYAPVYLPGLTTGVVPGPVPARAEDFALLTDQFVGGGDLVATAKVTGMLGRMGRAFNVRIGARVNFEDLRGSPSVLVGYSSTHWAEVTKEFRYYIDDSDRSMIRDNGQPTEWYPHLTRDYHTDEDYAVVTRAFRSETHAAMILITGCSQYGTEAAANLITSPELLAIALGGAPEGWQKKNLQLVLRLRVISRSPADPKVIAAHYW